MTDDEMERREADELRAWEEFVAGRPEEWRPLLRAICDKIGRPTTSVEADGTWSVDAEYGLGELRDVMRSAPRGFVHHSNAQDWWLAQHLESESDVLVNPTLFATICSFEHFQAGTSLTLTVYAAQAAYDEALRELDAGEDDAEDDG